MKSRYGTTPTLNLSIQDVPGTYYFLEVSLNQVLHLIPSQPKVLGIMHLRIDYRLRQVGLELAFLRHELVELQESDVQVRTDGGLSLFAALETAEEPVAASVCKASEEAGDVNERAVVSHRD